MQGGWRDAPFMLQDLVSLSIFLILHANFMALRENKFSFYREMNQGFCSGSLKSYGDYLTVCFFTCAFVLCSLILSEKRMIAFVSVSLFICFLCFRSL